MLSHFSENLVHLHSLFATKNNNNTKKRFIYWVENPNFLKHKYTTKLQASDNRHYTTQTLSFNIPLLQKNKQYNII